MGFDCIIVKGKRTCKLRPMVKYATRRDLFLRHVTFAIYPWISVGLHWCMNHKQYWLLVLMFVSAIALATYLDRRNEIEKFRTLAQEGVPPKEVACLARCPLAHAAGRLSLRDGMICFESDVFSFALSNAEILSHSSLRRGYKIGLHQITIIGFPYVLLTFGWNPSNATTIKSWMEQLAESSDETVLPPIIRAEQLPTPLGWRDALIVSAGASAIGGIPFVAFLQQEAWWQVCLICAGYTLLLWLIVALSLEEPEHSNRKRSELLQQLGAVESTPQSCAEQNTPGRP